MTKPRVALFSALWFGPDIARQIMACGLDLICAVSVNTTYRKSSGMGESYFGDLDGLCEEHDIPHRAIASMNDSDVHQWLQERQPDWILAIGWPLIIPTKILDQVGGRAIGFHPSLLPQGRGGAPLNWAIIDGEQEIGATLLMLDRSVDSGDIVWQDKMSVGQDDDIGIVLKHVGHLVEEGLVKILPRIASGSINPIPQDHSRATYRRRRRPADGEINWRSTSHQIHALVRALRPPFPGAWTTADGKKLKIWRTQIPKGIPLIREKPGTFIEVDGQVLVTTGDNVIELLEVEEGEGIQAAIDWYKDKDMPQVEIGGKFH